MQAHASRESIEGSLSLSPLPDLALLDLALALDSLLSQQDTDQNGGMVRRGFGNGQHTRGVMQMLRIALLGQVLIITKPQPVVSSFSFFSAGRGASHLLASFQRRAYTCEPVFGVAGALSYFRVWPALSEDPPRKKTKMSTQHTYENTGPGIKRTRSYGAMCKSHTRAPRPVCCPLQQTFSGCNGDVRRRTKLSRDFLYDSVTMRSRWLYLYFSFSLRDIS